MGDRYTSTINIDTKRWYYIISTRQSSTVSVYFNGVLDGTSSNTSNLTEGGFRLARNITTSYLNGNLALVQIYNRALSATEILQNYNATKTRFGL
jgi:outer membrane protein assembly factor BamE (lipoprotein component of BamABCDE complex)